MLSCSSYKLKPNGKVSEGFLYINPNPIILYMDFEYDMWNKALEKLYKTGNFEDKYLFDFKYRIKQEFEQACNDFFNNVIVKNPDFSPAIRERVLEHNEWVKKDSAKKAEELDKRIAENAKKHEAEKRYEATHPKPKCPTCGSTKVEKISTLNRAVSIGMVGLASDKIGKQFCCKNCGYKW